MVGYKFFLSNRITNKNTDRVMRSESDFKVVTMKTDIGRGSFSYQFLNSWNKLPFTLKECKMINIFDFELRKLLLLHRTNNHFTFNTRIVCQKVRL